MEERHCVYHRVSDCVKPKDTRTLWERALKVGGVIQSTTGEHTQLVLGKSQRQRLRILFRQNRLVGQIWNRYKRGGSFRRLIVFASFYKPAQKTLEYEQKETLIPPSLMLVLKKTCICVENIYYTNNLYCNIIIMRSEQSKERQRLYYKQWYEKNRERKITQNKEWNSTNKTKLASYYKDYYEANKERLNEQHKKRAKKNNYYEKNREKIIARSKEYYYRTKDLAKLKKS